MCTRRVALLRVQFVNWLLSSIEFGTSTSTLSLVTIVVARGPMDAPEVDLFALVTGSDALPGDFLKVRVEGVGEQFDLVCTPDDGTAS